MTFLKAIPGLVLLAIAIVPAPQAKASDLTGAILTGQIVAVPGMDLPSLHQFAPSAVVGSGTEFTGSFAVVYDDLIFNVSADFGPNSLTIAFSSLEPHTAYVAPYGIIDLVFSGLPPSFPGFNTITYGCDPTIGALCQHASDGLITNDFSGGSLTLGFGKLYAGDSYIFENAHNAPPVPEPSSLMLIGTGLLASVTAVRKSGGRRNP